MQDVVESGDVPQIDDRTKAHITVRINQDTLDDIEREAEKRGVSRTVIIQERLDWGGSIAKNIREILKRIRTITD